MYKDSLQLVIDSEKCIRCGKCIGVCKNRAVEPDPETNIPRVAEGGVERCMHCQQCMMICPTAALSLDGIKPEGCAPAGEYPEYAKLLNLVRGRRSVRDYKQKNVSPDVIAELMDAMRFTPTGVNHKKLHFGLIDDIEVMNIYRQKTYQTLKDELGKDPVPENAKPYEGLLKAYLAGEDPIFRTAPHLLVVSVPEDAPCPDADPLIAVSYFELLANAHGLGTCWFGRLFFLWRSLMPDLLEPFGIPEGYKPGYAILFGETALRYPRTGCPDPILIQHVQPQNI